MGWGGRERRKEGGKERERGGGRERLNEPEKAAKRIGYCSLTSFRQPHMAMHPRTT